MTRFLAATEPPHQVALALRCSVAAALAWLLTAPLGGLADSYHYYAPFGAVIAVSTTVTGSLRASWQVFWAFLLGTPLALLVQFCPLPTLVAIAVVAGSGTLLAQLPGLGSYGSWVPVSALFVLLIGQGEVTSFTLGYLGLTLMGALVGVVVVLLAPPLLLVRTERAQEALLDLLVVQLEGLADDVSAERDRASPPSDHRHQLQRSSDHLQQVMVDALGGPSVNWRVRRTRAKTQWLRERGDALGALALLVNDVAGTLNGDAAPTVSWGPAVEEAAAGALRASAKALREAARHAEDDPVRTDALLRDARIQVNHLADAIVTAAPTFASDIFSAAALAEGLRRTHDTLRERTPRTSRDRPHDRGSREC